MEIEFRVVQFWYENHTISRSFQDLAVFKHDKIPGDQFSKPLETFRIRKTICT